MTEIRGGPGKVGGFFKMIDAVYDNGVKFQKIVTKSKPEGETLIHKGNHKTRNEQTYLTYGQATKLAKEIVSGRAHYSPKQELEFLRSYKERVSEIKTKVQKKVNFFAKMFFKLQLWKDQKFLKRVDSAIGHLTEEVGKEEVGGIIAPLKTKVDQARAIYQKLNAKDLSKDEVKKLQEELAVLSKEFDQSSQAIGESYQELNQQIEDHLKALYPNEPVEKFEAEFLAARKKQLSNEPMTEKEKDLCLFGQDYVQMRGINYGDGKSEFGLSMKLREQQSYMQQIVAEAEKGGPFDIDGALDSDFGVVADAIEAEFAPLKAQLEDESQEVEASPEKLAALEKNVADLERRVIKRQENLQKEIKPLKEGMKGLPQAEQEERMKHLLPMAERFSELDAKLDEAQNLLKNYKETLEYVRKGCKAQSAIELPAWMQEGVTNTHLEDIETGVKYLQSLRLLSPKERILEAGMARKEFPAMPPAVAKRFFAEYENVVAGAFQEMSLKPEADTAAVIEHNKSLKNWQKAIKGNADIPISLKLKVDAFYKEDTKQLLDRILHTSAAPNFKQAVDLRTAATGVYSLSKELAFRDLKEGAQKAYVDTTRQLLNEIEAERAKSVTPYNPSVMKNLQTLLKQLSNELELEAINASPESADLLDDLLAKANENGAKIEETIASKVPKKAKDIDGEMNDYAIDVSAALTKLKENIARAKNETELVAGAEAARKEIKNLRTQNDAKKFELTRMSLGRSKAVIDDTFNSVENMIKSLEAQLTKIDANPKEYQEKKRLQKSAEIQIYRAEHNLILACTLKARSSTAPTSFTPTPKTTTGVMREEAEDKLRDFVNRCFAYKEKVIQYIRTNAYDAIDVEKIPVDISSDAAASAIADSQIGILENLLEQAASIETQPPKTITNRIKQSLGRLKSHKTDLEMVTTILNTLTSGRAEFEPYVSNLKHFDETIPRLFTLRVEAQTAGSKLVEAKMALFSAKTDWERKQLQAVIDKQTARIKEFEGKAKELSSSILDAKGDTLQELADLTNNINKDISYQLSRVD